MRRDSGNVALPDEDDRGNAAAAADTASTANEHATEELMTAQRAMNQPADTPMGQRPPHGHVGVLNLMYLMAVREAAARDAVRASYEFGMTRDELQQLQALSIEAVHTVASQLDRSMLALRYSVDELRELSALPSPLAVLMAPSRG